MLIFWPPALIMHCPLYFVFLCVCYDKIISLSHLLLLISKAAKNKGMKLPKGLKASANHMHGSGRVPHFTNRWGPCLSFFSDMYSCLT